MKHVRKHHFVLLPLVLAAVVGGWVFLYNKGSAEASSPACPNGSYVLVDGSTSGTNQAYPLALAPGPHQLTIIVPASMTSSIVATYYFLDSDSNYIGQAVNPSGGTSWPMTWYSQVSPSGNHTVSATVVMSSGSCTISMPSYVSINNSATYSFGVIPNPTGYSGYTNQPADFTLASKAQDTSGSGALDITPWTMFQKSAVSVGSITPANYASAFHFYSGPNAGQGSIHVVAYYGGVARTMDIPVQVYAQPTPTTSTTTSPTPTTTSSPPSSTSPPPSTQSSSGSTAPTTTTSSSTATNTPPPSIATDSPIRSCIIAKITQARFDAINSGQSRPTPAEFDAMQQCFATQNFEVPNNFSTVPPSKTIIKAKPVAHDVTVAAAATVTTKVKGAAVEALKFTGKAKPNSTVLLYLFSEPIVITTSSNADGEWSYSLQDPMAPGKHEAYALVDKGTGDYERSSVFDFAIAKASAVSSNPNGYSLKIEPNVGTATANNNATVLYVGGIAGLIGIVLAILAFVFVRKQKKNSTMSMPESSDIAPIAPQIAAVPPAENVNPVIPTAPETPAEIVTPTEPTDTSGPTV